MKKNLFLSLILFFTICLASQGQTQKGSKLIGGGAGLQFNDPFYIGVSPNIGFFVADNLAIGGSLPISFQKGENYHSAFVGLSPFIRYYFGGPSTTRFFGKASVGLGYNWSKSTYENKEYESSTINNSLGLGVGIVHFITQQIGLEAILGFNSDQGESSPRSNRLGINVGLQIYLPGSSQ